MPDNTPQPPPEPSAGEPELSEVEPDGTVWDPRQVMRDRAATTRRQRDESIAELRAHMTDEEILDEFGINIGEIEN